MEDALTKLPGRYVQIGASEGYPVFKQDVLSGDAMYMVQDPKGEPGSYWLCDSPLMDNDTSFVGYVGNTKLSLSANPVHVPWWIKEASALITCSCLVYWMDDKFEEVKTCHAEELKSLKVDMTNKVNALHVDFHQLKKQQAPNIVKKPPPVKGSVASSAADPDKAAGDENMSADAQAARMRSHKHCGDGNSGNQMYIRDSQLPASEVIIVSNTVH